MSPAAESLFWMERLTGSFTRFGETPTLRNSPPHERNYAMARRFPPPWTAEEITGGYVVVDANGQSIAYVYARDSESDAQVARVLTKDEARRIARNIAKLPELLEPK
jgi:hypothetical protein